MKLFLQGQQVVNVDSKPERNHSSGRCKLHLGWKRLLELRRIVAVQVGIVVNQPGQVVTWSQGKQTKVRQQRFSEDWLAKRRFGRLRLK